MAVNHWDLKKRKASGGKKRAYRTKRNYETGSFPSETRLGELRKKVKRGRGGNKKIKLLSENHANITNTKGETERVKIIRVVKNPANIDYDRRGVITKGAIIETTKGLARVTSRVGQSGVINAHLLKK